MMSFEKPLPIDEFRDVIIRQVEHHPVVILTAETGAGKSTRVPYWFWKRGKRVHVTQPRRIAARSLAYYLAHELSLELGVEIGYQTGFESKKSGKTTLLYLTDGVKMVQEIKGNRDYDILILDEIHEWNLNQEVLVGLAKSQLESGLLRRSGKRIVVMSATLKASQFSAFFNGAPVISVPGRGFPVSVHCHNPLFLLPDAAQMVEEKRNILVFQPGKQEIEEFSRNLRMMLEEDKLKSVILPFHSELSLKDQSRVFDHHAVPKVVVATDIAQTSLTIDDIDAVIDCGIKKEVRVVSGIEGLYPVDISGSECWQRAGRAGRVKKGVYILCADSDIGDRPEFPDPEIRRLNLETVTLRMFQWGLDPRDFPFFHKPRRNLVLRAIDSLMAFGALTPDLEVTPDGRRMAELPVSIRSARLLLEAAKGGPRVTDRAVKIIAISESKGIVSREYQGERYDTGPYYSDLLNQLALWEGAKKNPRLVSEKKMALAREIYQELIKRLAIPAARGFLTLKENGALFRAVLSGFLDSIYFRSENGYCRGEELRQIDRNSLAPLMEKRPEMVAGLPFDLMVSRTNSQTGKTEEYQIPLLTFCSEVSLALLEELQPFSYRKEKEIKVEEGRLTITDNHTIAGRLLKTVERQADWQDAVERKMLIDRAMDWINGNLGQLELDREVENNRRWFSEVASFLPGNLQPFKHLWDRFLGRELEDHLRMQDIACFVATHPGLRHVRLDRLLPRPIIRRICRQNWPQEIVYQGRSIPVRRIGGRVFIEVGRDDFMKMEETDALLPTGERAGIILAGRRFPSWTEAVDQFNQSLKRETFKKKWFFDRKKANMKDLLEIPFPVSFVGGRGKGNVVFEFYSAPALEGRGVSLIHFQTLQEAENYFTGLRDKWETAKREFKKEKLDTIFREKGWRVK